MPSSRRKVETSALDANQSKALLLSRKFATIEVCGIPTTNPARYEDETGKEGRLIHWRIHGQWLVAGGKKESLVFDTKKDETTKDITVDVIHVPYERSHNQVCGESFEPQRTINGADLVKLIERKGLHHCSYNAEGSGCLTWCRRVVKELVKAGYLESDAVETLNAKVESIEAKYGNRYWVPKEDGARFAESEE